MVLDSCIASVAERTDVRDSFDSSFDAISLGNASNIKLTIEHTVARMTFLEQCFLVFEKNISYYISRNAQGAFKTIIKSDKNSKSDR